MHDVDRCGGACASIDPVRCARARCVQRRARAPLSVLRLRTPDFPHCKVCTYYNICNLSTYMWRSLGQLSLRVARHRSYPCIHCSLAQASPSFCGPGIAARATPFCQGTFALTNPTIAMFLSWNPNIFTCCFTRSEFSPVVLALLCCERCPIASLRLQCIANPLKVRYRSQMAWIDKRNTIWPSYELHSPPLNDRGLVVKVVHDYITLARNVD